MATSDKSWLCTDRPRAPHWDPELCLSVPSYSVDASEIADLHVISYEVERDLIPLILSNCQYQVEQGGETLQEFDLEKIQRQIISRFLQGKPRLTLKARLTCCVLTWPTCPWSTCLWSVCLFCKSCLKCGFDHSDFRMRRDPLDPSSTLPVSVTTPAFRANGSAESSVHPIHTSVPQG